MRLEIKQNGISQEDLNLIVDKRINIFIKKVADMSNDPRASFVKAYLFDVQDSYTKFRFDSIMVPLVESKGYYFYRRGSWVFVTRNRLNILQRLFLFLECAYGY